MKPASPATILLVFLIFILFILAGCGQEATASSTQLTAVIVKEYPHDPTAFTQGLILDKGTMYESTGLYGQSSLRQVDLATGRVIQQRDYDRQFFAEGITVLGESIYQLTWTNRVIFQYDKNSFALRRTFPWPREGWGLTHDGSSLIVSDGTAHLYFLAPDSMTEQRQLTVHDGGQEINRLNELEYVNGSIYANVWYEQRIAVINPQDGAVTAWIDLSALCARMQGNNAEAVLNGIMHDSESGRLVVTGKLWPALFEIKTVPATAKQH
ncbi:glutaminyl-peptide cyclotransferase [Candidatus Electronema sp. PJ]|uniref:glutaminyl-peptide cyclotransferase n=1 Tax=Candidatus Electronema sp. PJ TaxID=3401572 RepID=UPI003AA97DFA